MSHDLKPSIHGSTHVTHGYFPIQGSHQHLRTFMETPFIHGWGSIIHDSVQHSSAVIAFPIFWATRDAKFRISYSYPMYLLSYKHRLTKWIS